MTREEVFAIWAPDGSPWSAWAKAVLFAYLPEEIAASALPISPAPPLAAPRDTALLIELGGARSVEAGLGLAAEGYRPVPLYNACPYANGPFQSQYSSIAAPALVDLVPTLREIADGITVLESLTLPLSAPPAFLIDAHRHEAAYRPDTAWFDNRSILRPADLPSAEFLKRHGITRVVLVQADRKLRSDMRAVLFAWQEAGVHIGRQTCGNAWNPEPYFVPRQSLFTSLWSRLQLQLRFRANSSGSFGRFVHGAGG